MKSLWKNRSNKTGSEDRDSLQLMGKEKGGESNKQEDQPADIKQIPKAAWITIVVVFWFLAGLNCLRGNESLFWVIEEFAGTEGGKTRRKNKESFKKMFR
jgi:hypothetical protein